jgi:enamine deaminase RidA (YjgF/YER057c/UK114 family)
MTLELISPDDLPTPPTYTHVVIATGSRLVFVAGQEPEDEDGNLVAVGDLAVQARQVFSNVGRALAAAGARPEQVTRITIFVVGYRREHLRAIEAGRLALFGDHKPPGLPDRGAQRSRSSTIDDDIRAHRSGLDERTKRVGGRLTPHEAAVLAGVCLAERPKVEWTALRRANAVQRYGLTPQERRLAG